jgi:hypothetical protein
MEMASSQGKKEEIAPAVIFVVTVGIVVIVAIAATWEVLVLWRHQI